MSIAQPALQEEPMPVPNIKPNPKPEPVPMEEADVALDEVVEEAVLKPAPQVKPPPKLENVPVAQVTQDASADVLLVDQDRLGGWLKEQIEHEKYYPPAAERFGLTGMFNLIVQVDESGVIRSAEIIDGNGHRILRQALERMLSKIIGRRYKNPIGEPMGFEVEFEFE